MQSFSKSISVLLVDGLVSFNQIEIMTHIIQYYKLRFSERFARRLKLDKLVFESHRGREGHVAQEAI